MLGTRAQKMFVVTEDDLAPTMYPDIPKPPVLASSRALQWAELVAMTALGGCAVGAGFELDHVAPAGLSAAVVVTAWCERAEGRRSSWAVEIMEVSGRLLAYGRLRFVLVDFQRFITKLAR